MTAYTVRPIVDGRCRGLGDLGDDLWHGTSAEAAEVAASRLGASYPYGVAIVDDAGAIDWGAGFGVVLPEPEGDGEWGAA